jgi:20S proteasome subunit beta 5
MYSLFTFIALVLPISSSVSPLASLHSQAITQAKKSSAFDKPPVLDLGDGTTLDVFHGTTTLAFVYGGGIIAAVDSRASLGKLVGSRTTDKVLPVSKFILGTMAGGAADCSYWIRALSTRVRQWELTEGAPCSATVAAHTLVNMVRQNRGLSVGTMIMGADNAGQPCIYYIDDSGVCVRGDVFSVGSGSNYAISVLDGEVRRHDLSQEEAVALAVRAIQRATHRDAFSGGYINVYHISPTEGWHQVSRIDSAQLEGPIE